MKTFGLFAGAAALAVGAGLALPLVPARGQQVHRNGFETREAAWVRGAADVSYQETAHAATDQTAHTGQYSEAIELTAQQGSFIYYYYPVGRAPLGDELSASVFVKANRPGARLLARLVLPRERDPNNLDERMTVTIRGDVYERVGRWQRLEIRRPLALAREQQQMLRLELKRDVDFTEAYLDRLVLNLYGGPGQTRVWVDDVEVGPVLNTPFQTMSRPAPAPGALVGPARPAARASIVEFRNGLQVGGKRFFFRGIRVSDTPLEELRKAGFNTVWMDSKAPADQLEKAADLGFWIVPSLPATADDPRVSSPEGLGQLVSRWTPADAVLFWDLGGGLAKEQAEQVGQAVQAVRSADPQRPLAVDAWDGFGGYSRSVEMVGAHRWPLGTGLELTQYHRWLEDRLNFNRPGTLCWTWVQTHLPDWYTTQVYGHAGTEPFTEPIGPQPEQIRLLTYCAVAAGCRGIGFWSDRFLADSHQGRDRLLELALLNQELQLLEPMLVTAELMRWIDAVDHRGWALPDVKAAVLRSERGILVLPIWLGKGSQFVPGQFAVPKISLVVPAVPAGTTAWLVSPGEVRSLQTERVPGGTKVTIPEFSLTAAVVFTSDNNPTGLLVRFQDQVRRMCPRAAAWAKSLAEVELQKVAHVEGQLERGGHTLPDGPALVEDARRRLRLCGEHLANNDYRQAYAEAQRVLRPLRILMRAQWEQAVRGLDTPVASPYAVSFFTLPRYWQWMDELRGMAPGPNQLPGGDFEAAFGQNAATWLQQETHLDEVVTEARRTDENPKEGRQCLMLRIRPRNPLVPPAALERTFLAIHSPPVSLPPGTRVRVSAWVRVPEAIKASPDGVLFYDSAGGEPLAVRLTDATGWKRFTLLRQVPASGTLTVTLALTGLGTVYFDDIRIEPLGRPGGLVRPVGAVGSSR